MDINNNIDILNSFISNNRFEINERYIILKIAKVSNDIDDLIENIEWERKIPNIKK